MLINTITFTVLVTYIFITLDINKIQLFSDLSKG